MYDSNQRAKQYVKGKIKSQVNWRKKETYFVFTFGQHKFW